MLSKKLLENFFIIICVISLFGCASETHSRKPSNKSKDYVFKSHYLEFHETKALAKSLGLNSGQFKTQNLDDSEKWLLHFNQGNIHMSDMGQIDKAISEYTLAIETNQTEDRAYNNRGCAYCIKGLLEQGIADFSTAINKDPNDSYSYNNRGIAYMLSGLREKGCYDLKRACELRDCDNYMLSKSNGDCK